ncbi:MAG: hypothetical protein J6V78_02710 [Clostridia bacterium]|nr:hypothetical protein [Clostridia bacterium]
MKKVLSVLLATLMFFTLLMPLSVFAENGPAPIDWEEWANVDLESLDMTDLDVSFVTVIDYENEEMGYVYPDEIAAEAPVTVKGISYDKATNTLTLNNVRLPYAGIGIAAMGDDFKIKLVGYNEIGTLATASLSWGCSTTLVGNGELVVNKNLAFSEALNLDFTGVETGFFKASSSVALKLCGVGYDEYGVLVYPTVEVTQAPNADFSKVLILDGNVKESVTTKSQKLDVNVYEQVEAYCLYDIAIGNLSYFRKSGDTETLYAGKEIIEDGYSTGYYDLYIIEFDETFDMYLAKKMDGCERVKPGKLGYVGANYSDEIFDLMRQEYLALWPASREMLNVAYDENGTKCVFDEYLDEYAPDMYSVITQSYPLIDHPEYGKVALTYTYFRGGQPNIKEKALIEAREVYNFKSFTSTITMNNGGSVLPGKVKLQKAASAFGGVNVTWNAVSGADSYTVYRKAAGAKNWTTLGTSKTTSYLDTTAKTGTKYTYTVRAKNIVGLGAYDTAGVSTTYIAAPTVKIANATNGIKVSWNKVSGATGYTVYRSQYSGGKWSGWKNMGTAKADKASWTDKSVKSGVQYKYTVRTVKNKLMSSYKATDGLVYLSTPTVKIANASTGVKVTWGKVAGAKNYAIYRSELASGKWSGWKKISTVGAVTSTVDKTAKSGVNYKYTVKAVNGSSTGAYKASAQLLCLAQPTVTIANASNGIKVSWSKSAGAKGYTVYRSQYSNGKWSSWKTMGTAAATKTSWVDKSVKSGIQYKYTVRTVNGTMKSSYKATSGLVFLSPPTVKASNISGGVNVSWSKVAGATQYKLYRSELKDGKWSSWSTLTNLKADTTTFVDKTVVVDAVYKYAVKPINGSSLGAYTSDEIWYCYAPAISIVNGETGIVVNWEHFNGAEKYIFYRSEEKNGKWTEWKTVKTVKSTTEYWVDETVVSDVKYKYAIKAQKGDDKTASNVSNKLVYIKTRYVF